MSSVKKLKHRPNTQCEIVSNTKLLTIACFIRCPNKKKGYL